MKLMLSWSWVELWEWKEMDIWPHAMLFSKVSNPKPFLRQRQCQMGNAPDTRLQYTWTCQQGLLNWFYSQNNPMNRIHVPHYLLFLKSKNKEIDYWCYKNIKDEICLTIQHHKSVKAKSAYNKMRWKEIDSGRFK